MSVDHLLFCCRATIWCMAQTITYREYAAYAALPLDELDAYVHEASELLELVD